MGEKDYYEFLGVERTATAETLRAAYRRLAKESHPDLSGSDATRRFREITEAYGVLSDPEMRRAYDEELERSRRCAPLRAPRHPAVAPAWPGRHPVEPVTAHAKTPSRKPLPLVDEIVESLFSDPGAVPLAATHPRHAPHVEVILSRAEARRGGILAARLALPRPCPQCRGTGLAGSFVCRRCRGACVVAEEHRVNIEIPAGVTDRTRLITYSHCGFSRQVLVVLLRVRRER